MQINLSKSLVSLLTLVAGVTVCHGASFITDFNSGLPAGSSIYGSAFVDTAGGVTNSGTLKVTTAAGNLQGSYIVEDIAGGVPITNFTLSYKLNLGGLNTGNRIADGMSFCYGTDLPNATWGEEGVGNGLVITFDTWDNAAPDSAPAIEVHYGGATL